jgi:hypothetical protein
MRVLSNLHKFHIKEDESIIVENVNDFKTNEIKRDLFEEINLMSYCDANSKLWLQFLSLISRENEYISKERILYLIENINW